MRALPVVALLVVGALLYLGAQEALRSRSLQLARFEVTGNSEDRVSTDQVIRATGVKVGDQLVGISTREVGERLERLPWVRQARVERILPSTLRISVDERKASLVVHTNQGPYLVDDRGLVLQQGSENLVNLVDLPLPVLSPGSVITTPEFTHSARILRSLPDGIRDEVSTVRAASIDQIQLEMSGGPVIYYGAAEDIQAKNHAADALLQRSADSPATTGIIDVRVPSRPSTRSL
ncbi:MAG TPA: FtsQ-type POTRA domain-containing protein [Actinomycetota bacterium]|nr:FtsQ-type POTRA domain-containing protein [Actinomycetota bacterium]